MEKFGTLEFGVRIKWSKELEFGARIAGKGIEL